MPRNNNNRHLRRSDDGDRDDDDQHHSSSGGNRRGTGSNHQAMREAHSPPPASSSDQSKLSTLLSMLQQGASAVPSRETGTPWRNNSIHVWRKDNIIVVNLRDDLEELKFNREPGPRNSSSIRGSGTTTVSATALPPPPPPPATSSSTKTELNVQQYVNDQLALMRTTKGGDNSGSTTTNNNNNNKKANNSAKQQATAVPPPPPPAPPQQQKEQPQFTFTDDVVTPPAARQQNSSTPPAVSLFHDPLWASDGDNLWGVPKSTESAEDSSGIALAAAQILSGLNGLLDGSPKKEAQQNPTSPGITVLNSPPLEAVKLVALPAANINNPQATHITLAPGQLQALLASGAVALPANVGAPNNQQGGGDKKAAIITAVPQQIQQAISLVQGNGNIFQGIPPGSQIQVVQGATAQIIQQLQAQGANAQLIQQLQAQGNIRTVSAQQLTALRQQPNAQVQMIPQGAQMMQGQVISTPNGNVQVVQVTPQQLQQMQQQQWANKGPQQIQQITPLQVQQLPQQLATQQPQGQIRLLSQEQYLQMQQQGYQVKQIALAQPGPGQTIQMIQAVAPAAPSAAPSQPAALSPPKTSASSLGVNVAAAPFVPKTTK